jgi:hypothetical protein
MSTLPPATGIHFSQNAHTETTDNGKVRPFHHDNMVLFACSLLLHPHYLTLDVLALNFGWLSLGKCFKLLVEPCFIHDYASHHLLLFLAVPQRLSRCCLHM